MKTKSFILFCFILFSCTILSAQDFFIEGPETICEGECGDYYIVDANGQQVFIEMIWQGPSGFDQIGVSASYCFLGPGVYLLTATELNGQFQINSSITVSDYFQPEIIALSGAYCPGDVSNPGGPNSCDAVCANTTVTYTTEINDPTTQLSWEVSGAESYTVNGNEVTVTWGEPGNGQVYLEVYSGTPANDMVVSCGSYGNSGPGGAEGVGYVNISGSSNNYIAELSNGGFYTWNNGLNYVNNLPGGTYTVTVTDALDGSTAECSFSIIETDIACTNAAIVLDVEPPSDCNSCDGFITGTIIGDAFPPFSYQWSNGSTGPFPQDVCPGTYTVWVTDSFGCAFMASTNISCGTTSGCYGSNSICVDILAIPEAQFETTPPAINGIVEICEGQTVFFENQTTGASTYTWDFGNSISSSEVDAEHTYLSSGTYEALLIARNDCFCSDTTFITILVQDAISPEIDCAGTVCPNTEVTYTSDSDCSVFNWAISSNGTIIGGGSTSDNYITVDWGAGPEGLIELTVEGCSGNYCLETMFESIPIIDDNALIRGPVKVCKGEETIYSITPFAGTEFNWSTSAFGTITGGQGTNEITVQWAEFPVQDQWVAVDYESCYLGCGGNDLLNVDILNEFFIEGPVEACNNETNIFISRTPELSNNEVPTNWTIYDETGATVMTSGTPTSNFPVTWSFGSGTFTVYAEAANPADYCVNNFSIFVDIPTATQPPLLVNGPTVICPGQTYTYSALSSGGPFDYTWYVSNGGANTILHGETVNITWAGTPPYHIDLTQTNIEGLACESEEISLDLSTINSVSLSGTDFVCHEEVGSYTATPYQNIDYSWQISPADAGTIISGENSNQVDIQWHTPGTFDVQVTVCGETDTHSTTVHPRPNPTVIFDLPCPGQATSVQTTQPYTAYEWRNESGFVLSNGPVVSLTSGYYEVIVTDNNGCTQNESFYVGTLSTPEITISTPDFGTFCQIGGTMTLYTLETSSGFDYQWFHNGIPVGGNTSSLTVTEEGTYYVEVTNVNGCEGVSNSLGLSCGILEGPPNPGCIPAGFMDFLNTPGSYCNQSQFTNTSVNDIPGTWYWSFFDFGAGTEGNSTLENPSYTYQTAGFHLVTLQGMVETIPPGGACPSFTFQFDTVPLAADFAFDPGCSGDALPFFDLSTYIPQTSIAGWSWNFGDPLSGAFNTSNLQNPVHSFTGGGNFSVTLTVTDQSGCISQLSQVVQVEDPPLASFTLPPSGCESTTLPFNAVGNFNSVNWNFGDPASGAANTSDVADTWHQYDAPGTYTITLTTQNIYGCESVFSQQIDILNNGLNGIISFNPTNEICEGDSTVLKAPDADTYLWNTTEITQTISVQDAGLYEVTVYDQNGCSYIPPALQIDVIPLPQAQISAVEYNEYEQPVEHFYNNYETCFGENVYLEITENPNYTYQWSTGEFGTEISFTEDKENLLSVGTHTFEVSITDVTTGCTNVIGPFTVTVHPTPDGILITSSPAMPVCENTPTVFQVFNPDPNYTYVWNTGELGTSITSFYAGEYFVRAINEFGCEGESNTLEIISDPNVDLIPQGCHSRCTPDTICLPDIIGVASFQWYQDGIPIPAPEGTVEEYIATESGEYHVEMVSTDGCVTVSDALTLDLFDGYGSIFGEVWFDLNDNGIIDGADTLMSGISIILQNSGINLDTLVSNQTGSIAFANILSTDYDILVDILNLPPGFEAVIAQAASQLVGCDDEDAVAFLIRFECINTTGSETLYACEGDSVEYNSDFLFPGSATDYVFTTAQGCDSTVTVAVIELTETSSEVNLQACTGSTVDYNGTALSGGTTTDFTFQNAAGCDSTVTVIVALSNIDSVPLNLSACTGEFANYQGDDLPPGSQTDYYFTNQNNCDSIVTVIVQEIFETSNTLQFEACEGSSINVDGTDYLAGTISEVTLTNVAGCDSILTIEVAELLESTGNEMLEACEGTTVNYNGTDLDPGSTTDFVFQNAVGCDSVVTVEVAALQNSVFEVELTACEGESANYNGTEIDAGESMDFTFSGSNGCDSVVTVEVLPLSLFNTDVDLSACEGTTAEYNGDQLPAGSVTNYVYTSYQGCDSTVTVSVENLLESTYDLSLSACENGTATYNGQDLPPGSSTIFVFENVAGCDSTVTVSVASLPVDFVSLELIACPDETVDYNGEQLSPGTTAEYVYTNQQGCDSVVQVTVSAHPDFAFSLSSLESCWNAAQGVIFVDNLNGGTAPFTYSLDGENYQAEDQFSDVAPGSYEIFVQDDQGCINSLVVEVESISPMIVIAEDQVISCELGITTIETEVLADDPFAVTYLWPDGSTDPFLEADSAGMYLLTVSNSCETITQAINVSFEEDARESFLFVPNVFSPNGDGMNDLFQVYPAGDIEVVSFELYLFDRWGNTLNHFPDTGGSWDGSFRGKRMNPGVYVWYYKATVVACGRTINLFEKGDVTLVK